MAPEKKQAPRATRTRGPAWCSERGQRVRSDRISRSINEDIMEKEFRPPNSRGCCASPKETASDHGCVGCVTPFATPKVGADVVLTRHSSSRSEPPDGQRLRPESTRSRMQLHRMIRSAEPGTRRAAAEPQQHPQTKRRCLLRLSSEDADRLRDAIRVQRWGASVHPTRAPARVTSFNTSSPTGQPNPRTNRTKTTTNHTPTMT